MLTVLFTGALVSSCNESAQPVHTGVPAQEHEQVAAVEHEPVKFSVQPSTQKAASDAPGAALNLSIRDIADIQSESDTGVEADHSYTMMPGSQDKTLTSKKDEDGIKLSGKLFTDQAMIDSKDYLNSVDGVKLNIEGKFR